MELNVLLIGSGGREHAMAWSMNQSPMLGNLFVAPGNPGTAQTGENVPLDINNFEEVAQFIEENEVDLTVVGPEKPLVDGITDFLEDRGHNVFGPSKKAAQLEGSKKFANDFMEENFVPTADYATFDASEFEEAYQYIIEKDEYPIVLKADGLAGGKGVFICESPEEAEMRLTELQENEKLQEAAQSLVVEEYLEGEEASVFVITDGQSAKIIHDAQDHKRVGEGDTGLNTGGMGAYGPAPIIDDAMMDRVEKEIVLPTISAMILDDTPYKGILYCGLMITESGPKVVEYNCRFGDPECQVILPALQSDWLELMWAAVNGNLDDHEVQVDSKYHTCVVLTSGGYPEAYEKGKTITGLNNISDDALVFHAGTARREGQLITDGGRVLNVVCRGDTLDEAIENTYKQVEKISFDQMYFRNDIGHKGLAHLK